MEMCIRDSLYLAWRQSLSFDVALLDGQPVGFQFSTGGGGGAHLSLIHICGGGTR